MKFQLKNNYYPQPTWEFNLPAGWSCPYADKCKIKIDRETGKFDNQSKEFRCYAASSEKFPAVRKSRWENFEAIKNDEEIIIPKGATHIKIHGSGDFFSQEYFDKWLMVAKNNPDVLIWTFTKLITFLINRLNDILPNFKIIASKGGLQDDLIEKHNLIYAEVFTDINKLPKNMPIDTDDSWAMRGDTSFALLDNNKYSKKQGEHIK